MTLRDRIRELANDKGMSLPVLEATLGFGNGTIVRWDKSSPTAEKLQKVADYFNVSVDYLLGRDNDRDTPVNSDSDEHYTPAFFRLKQGLEPYNISESDVDFLLDVYKAHIKKNQ